MMNLLAACCALFTDIKVIAFTIMSNHLHIVLIGSENDIHTFFKFMKKRLSNFCSRQNNPVNLLKWECTLKEINDIGYLRNTIAYVHRNGFVIDRRHTPFSYPWGTGPYYFNNNFPLRSKLSGDISSHEKREIFKTRQPSVPDNFVFLESGYVWPGSFCDIELGMSIFRDAHQYMALLSRNVEAYSKIAADMMEDVLMTDEELYSATSKICKAEFDANSARELDIQGRIRLARKLHYDFKAGNSQIARVTGLPIREVERLFPLSSAE